MFVMRHCIPQFEIKSRIVANNILPILGFGFIIINMDKLKKGLLKLFAPAIVLLLVVAMGVFSPVVSVVAALRLSIAAAATPVDCVITNLPARTVKVGDKILNAELPSVTNGYVKLVHAGKEVAVAGLSSDFVYSEVGQYEWRFYTDSDVLFDTYMVTATKTAYTMSMPSDVITVAPKGLNQLELPLPNRYTIAGETVEVDTVASDNGFAAITFKDHAEVYHLVAKVSLENDTFAANKITYGQKNITIDLNGHKDSTGNLKVTYLLKNDSDKLLVATPLTDIEIKNVNKSDVTFANIPTAPSVSNLSYYSSVSLTAPAADSAKVGSTSFAVEAKTSIAQVQVYLFPTEPKKWNGNADVHTLTVDANGVVKEGDTVSDLLEIDGLNVKVKALGWYRFQFQTSTLFGYKMDDKFDNYDAIEQDSDKSYVRYWSDTVRIYRDSIEPNFAWVDDYNAVDANGEYTDEVKNQVKKYNENFSDYLDDYDAYLPMTEKPSATTAKKVTVNFNQGLVLPAIFPHDNATSFADMQVTAFAIDQIEDADGNTVSDNYVWKGENSSEKYFKYDMRKHLQITFADNGTNGGAQGENNLVVLKKSAGLYRVRIVVEEKQPVFAGNNEKYSGGYAQTKTKYLYFYVEDESSFDVAGDGSNSPVIDESKAFQVSDVYLWEGSTFDFAVPSIDDAHTSNNALNVDYYLVYKNASSNEVVAKLDYTKGAARINVDLNNLKKENGTKVTFADLDENGTYYIYAVAQNFNGMQADLKYKWGIAGADKDATHFQTSLFSVTPYGTEDEVARYGFAWKRAEFKLHDVDSANTAQINFSDSNVVATDGFVAGKTIKITNVNAEWDGGAKVDGQLSVAVYQVKSGKLQAVNLVNKNDTSAEVVSTYTFKRNELNINELYFTPGVSGDYIFVIAVKDNASSKVTTKVTKITIGANSDIGVRPRSLNTAAVNSDTVDASISVGESLTLPDYDLVDSSNKLLYTAKNHELFEYDTNGVMNTTAVGDYTVTVMGVNDPNCVTGNKFVPNKTGKYKFKYEFYRGAALVKTVNYIVQVNNANDSTSILMGEDYNEKTIRWVATTTDAAANDTATIAGTTYHVGANETGTSSKPAYAITLPQFQLANYGAATDFVVDTASLFDYLEPIYGAKTATNDSNITGYMYPAILIPMPNIVKDTASSDEVEITVQKSGSSNYLVSSKKLNAGGSKNKASVIDTIDGYYVFRPEGTFSKACENATPDNYLLTANSKNGASGVYTITYKTSTASVSYNITIGNLKNGEISWNDGFLTYNNGKEDKNITEASDDLIIDKDSDGHRYVTIDMSKLFFSGNDDMLDLIAQGPNGDGTTTGYNSDNSDAATEYYWSKVTVTVYYEDGSFVDYDDWSDAADATAAIKNHSNYTYKFDLTKGSGTYKVTVKMTNSYTSSPVSKSIEFTLDAESTNKNVNLNTVWGVILIVLSVGLLAGVIFYFVKTARATRFVDAPRAMKAKDKKEDDKKVAAPKDAEAPKNDAK